MPLGTALSSNGKVDEHPSCCALQAAQLGRVPCCHPASPRGWTPAVHRVALFSWLPISRPTACLPDPLHNKLQISISGLPLRGTQSRQPLPATPLTTTSSLEGLIQIVTKCYAACICAWDRTQGQPCPQRAGGRGGLSPVTPTHGEGGQLQPRETEQPDKNTNESFKTSGRV